MFRPAKVCLVCVCLIAGLTGCGDGPRHEADDPASLADQSSYPMVALDRVQNKLSASIALIDAMWINMATRRLIVVIGTEKRNVVLDNGVEIICVPVASLVHADGGQQLQAKVSRMLAGMLAYFSLKDRKGDALAIVKGINALIPDYRYDMADRSIRGDELQKMLSGIDNSWALEAAERFKILIDIRQIHYRDSWIKE